MRIDRLLLASATCALMAGAAVAQTTTTSTTRSTTTGAMAAQPGTTSSSTTTTSNTTGAMSGQTGMTANTGAQTTTSGMQTSPSAGMQTGGAMTAAAGAPFQPITPAAGADLVSVLQASGQFTTLLKAVAATGLTPVLQRPGALTVFAPTDAAFAALPPGQLATLMQPANAQQLQQLILLHVVNTPIHSAELLNHAFINVPTVATGKTVHLDGSTGTLKVDGNAVLQSDVHASNGTVFVIGQVLSPNYVAPTTSEAANVPAAATAETPAASTTTSDTKSTTTKSTSSKKHKH
ncbi:MAG: fasciclin domain-containing protein [Caulobacteraceae bacterium]|nr:fasciclin domain-containing protein [Caulobacter sp.]